MLSAKVRRLQLLIISLIMLNLGLAGYVHLSQAPYSMLFPFDSWSIFHPLLKHRRDYFLQVVAIDGHELPQPIDIQNMPEAFPQLKRHRFQLRALTKAVYRGIAAKDQRQISHALEDFAAVYFRDAAADTLQLRILERVYVPVEFYKSGTVIAEKEMGELEWERP